MRRGPKKEAGTFLKEAGTLLNPFRFLKKKPPGEAALKVYFKVYSTIL